MAIPLTGAGSLFVRLGHIFGIANTVMTQTGTTIPGKTVTLYGDYVSTDQAVVSGLFPALSSYQSTPTGFLSYLQTLAQQTVIQMAADDQIQPNSNLSTALAYLIGQMTSATVKSCAIGSSITAGSANIGNAAFAIGTKSRDGKVLENTFAEPVAATVTNDAQSGGASVGRETVALRGLPANPSVLSASWPQGSGSSATLNLVTAGASQQGGTQNFLFNSNFETFTVANIPDGWHIATGTAGTTVLKSTAEHYDGTSSLQIAGNGTELTSLYQEFAIDTSVNVSPIEQYAVGFWAKVSATAGAGVLTVDLVDASGTTLLDVSGNASSFTVNLTGLTTSWAPQTGFLRTPRVLPSSTRLRLRISTALTNAINLFIDRLSFALPVQFYQQGPFFAGFSGSVAAILNDAWTITLTNDRGGDLATCWQAQFDRYFGMRANGLLLPSAGSPTILGSLIT